MRKNEVFVTLVPVNFMRFLANILTSNRLAVSQFTEWKDLQSELAYRLPSAVIIDSSLSKHIPEIRLIWQGPLLVVGDPSPEQAASIISAGADDYLPKPVYPPELLARLDRSMRRWHELSEHIAPDRFISVGPVVLDRFRRELIINDSVIRPTPTEFAVLDFLMSRRDMTVSCRDILHHVWGPEYCDAKNYIRVYIGRIRKLLGRHAGAIVSVYKYGYRFDTSIILQAGIGLHSIAGTHAQVQ